MDNKSFKKLHGLFIEDIKIGQTAENKKIITEKDISTFSELTGDNNPVHNNEEFAKKTIFKKRVAHGFLTASLISVVIAKKLPGPGSIYLKQEIKFLAPVFINDEVLTKVTVESVELEKKIVNLATEGFKDNKKIITGNATVLVSSKKDFL